MDSIKIAAVCMNSFPGEIDRNLDRIKSFVQEASVRGADIICFPEASVTGYVLKNPENVYSSSPSEEILLKLTAMAGNERLIIIAGMIEKSDGEKPYLSQIVAGPDGLLGLYRKTHLSPPETGSYKAGQSLDTFCCKDIIFGVQLCYEAHFPEISTVMALKGADVIFIPHASPWGTPKEKMQSWMRHLPGRAFDNAVFVIACNQVGKTREGFLFPGVAVALNPAGRIISQYRGDQEKLVLVDLEMDELREIREHRMKYFLPNRRPELYTHLLTKRGPPIAVRPRNNGFKRRRKA